MTRPAETGQRRFSFQKHGFPANISMLIRNVPELTRNSGGRSATCDVVMKCTDYGCYLLLRSTPHMTRRPYNYRVQISYFAFCLFTLCVASMARAQPLSVGVIGGASLTQDFQNNIVGL